MAIITVQFDWDAEDLPHDAPLTEVQKAFVQSLQNEAYDNGWMRGTFEVTKIEGINRAASEGE